MKRVVYYIFIYDGTIGDKETGEFVDHITDCELRDEKTPHFINNIHAHKLTGFSKKDLWDEVLNFVSDKCIIEIRNGNISSLIKIGV